MSPSHWVLAPPGSAFLPRASLASNSINFGLDVILTHRGPDTTANQITLHAPSIGRSPPLMFAAASLHRKRPNPATSAGMTTRRLG
jgi:hypothetical protein